MLLDLKSYFWYGIFVTIRFAASSIVHQLLLFLVLFLSILTFDFVLILHFLELKWAIASGCDDFFKTVLGSVPIVEQLLFSMFPSILTLMLT